jgi:hypothetical protein
VKSTSRASQHIEHKSGSRQKKHEPSKELHIERKVKVKEASLSNLGWTYWGIWGSTRSKLLFQAPVASWVSQSTRVASGTINADGWLAGVLITVSVAII